MFWQTIKGRSQKKKKKWKTETPRKMTYFQSCCFCDLFLKLMGLCNRMLDQESYIQEEIKTKQILTERTDPENYNKPCFSINIDDIVTTLIKNKILLAR